MSAPNRATLHARVLVDELAKAGVGAVCVAPGSRSTPLTVAADAHPDLVVFSHLDERSAAFFALGRAKRSDDPVALVCTSGTAAANVHPAVVEASQARVPLVALTADRPPELRDSGANQTIDQEKLYGDAVRYYDDLPEPAVEDRTLRSLRVRVDRAVTAATGVEPGPVHLNVPFAKPLEPTDVPADSPHAVPEGWVDDHPLAAYGRDGPFVTTTAGRMALDDAALADLAAAIDDAERGLLVAGPTDRECAPALVALAEASGFPILADPLSGLRYGPHVGDVPVHGGYDGYLDERVTAEWPDPDLVLRIGASPTSKPLRRYLARSGARQVVVDPAGGWREATFHASDLVTAEPGRLAVELAERLDTESANWPASTFERAERVHAGEVAATEERFEGAIARRVVADAPDPATLVVSNSMAVRDVDRFGAPRDADLAVLGNRGASGIDGVTSTALGAGSATDDPLVLLIGDLAYYHDSNGLLALERCGVDATIVLVNNDGGGIFHMLPIEAFDPPFEGQFKTPHGLDFAPTAELYGFDYVRADDPDGFADAYRASLASDGTQVIEVASDAERSHRTRESLRERVVARLAD
ncbi:2-succinyl-5-enolpyruvyl-6-hydroxy-3-cyclohexene-1-carboxylate synthase [Halarchaeum rubridurum]|uniref:2-succinyl-5-enolpyruvyl-6-hydroxy-3-cyclohexene-1-carboxylate synthase n=1 Tax=Halarchaeum rubridurum TaxID=489911 RepID=A0A830G355_9EURY|nr:2-succinyl-5-enolpyruvyl-6-hydroxy-3-cyclohexene-1-carboxylic-acid synthase [Halarchaeum rubridurum]MBP1955596.1 2-succinyl-5-enolpyruvyl-6-hydroxy-3-cyclohexene-1-carboxylate synthase [Halarchaeum rubridurum]GGM73606.1 2-succinyl-5-enolpyruvyl-6-hydroxy-3-cyclohexene-1-carboxylate synthase [Halarchaeum rubridurum]